MERRLDAGREFAEEGLGDIYVDAHAANVGDLEQGASGGSAGADEIADIDAARRHHAVERRPDLLETGQFLQPADRSLLRHDIRLGDGKSRMQ